MNRKTIVVEYNVRAVLFTPFSLVFFLSFSAFAAIGTAIFGWIFYFRDKEEVIHVATITIHLFVATFLNGFLLVLITSPMIKYGARKGYVSFLFLFLIAFFLNDFFLLIFD